MERHLKKIFTSTKSVTVKIKSYQITSINVIPFNSCMIYLHLIDVNDIIYPRSIKLEGKEYLKYTDDDYICNYINESIHDIFNNNF